MKIICLILCFLCLTINICAQNKIIDSLKTVLTNKTRVEFNIGIIYQAFSVRKRHFLRIKITPKHLKNGVLQINLEVNT